MLAWEWRVRKGRSAGWAQRHSKRNKINPDRAGQIECSRRPGVHRPPLGGGESVPLADELVPEAQSRTSLFTCDEEGPSGALP